ncbi:MAG: transglycosylase SLT domain-containing protein [Gammaproteobacteria bacterium]|nr:transglycosylase SLT domain-containing protein [Gammaproteobacteria bacterium]
MVRSAVLAIGILVASLACADNSDSVFEEALHAARNDDWNGLAQAQKRLSDDHPLQAYLEFHRLRAALPDLSPQRVVEYGERYPDSPLPDDIRQHALVAYAKESRWRDVLKVYDRAPRGTELRCYYLRAQWENGDKGVLPQVRQLWLSGSSRPSSCDPLFEAARDQGVIGEQEIWERLLLAFDQGATGLMSYLADMQSGADATAGEWLGRLHRDPERLRELPEGIGDERREQLLSAALRRLAYTDTVRARELFEQESANLGLKDPALRERAAERIAWYSTIRGIEENRQWLDGWLANNGSADTLDQRARRSVIEQRWDELPDWVARLPAAARDDSRWQYWLGRAAEENGDDEAARAHWGRAAGQRNFYGFLAAERLGQAPVFSNASPATDDSAPTQPGLARVALLREIDEPQLAWDEWNWMLWHSSEGQRRKLAQHALQQGWYDLVVQASIQARAWNVLAWRFPAAHRDLFVNAARRHDLDPWLSMAVARRESAFYPHARSPVGAQGLMQLMPGTARKVARDAGQTPPDARQVMDPDINVALGTRYLAELLERFNGNRVLALAAYNAGPHRVDDWLAEEEDAVPADVWIESIPFYETREYVQAVLTYRVLFQGLHGNREELVLLRPDERGTPYSLAMMD